MRLFASKYDNGVRGGSGGGYPRRVAISDQLMRPAKCHQITISHNNNNLITKHFTSERVSECPLEILKHISTSINQFKCEMIECLLRVSRRSPTTNTFRHHECSIHSKSELAIFNNVLFRAIQYNKFYSMDLGRSFTTF